MNTRTARLTAGSTLIALGLALTGCAGLPVPGLGGEQLSEEAIEETLEEATGSSVDIGDSVEVPSSWPGLPLPEGTLIASVVVEDIYSLTYQLDGDAPIQALQDALLADGFVVQAESLGELSLWNAATPEWTVSLAWYEGDGGTVELQYGVAPTGS